MGPTPTTRPAAGPSGVDQIGQLGELLVRSSWRLRRGAAKELAPLGVTFGQARALRVLAASEPMRMADLAASLEIVPRSLTTMIDSLVAAGTRRTAKPTPTTAARCSSVRPRRAATCSTAWTAPAAPQPRSSSGASAPAQRRSS